jgi:hypothetical protein
LRYESSILNRTIDGQEDIAIDCISVFAGSSDLPYVIPANMSAGDSIPIGFTSVAVTDMVQKGGRDTVHFNYGNTDYYWDREKGALVEYTLTGGSLTMTLADTNMWGNGPSGSGLDWWVWTIIIAIPVILIALFALILRRRKPTTTLPPPPSTQPPPPPP